MPGSPPRRIAAPGTSPEPRTRSRAAMPLGYGSLPSQVTLSRPLAHGHGFERVPLPAGRTLPVPLEGARSAARTDVYFSCFCHDRILRDVRTVHKATGDDWRFPACGQKKRLRRQTACGVSDFLLVRPERFELPTHRFVACCSIQLSYERIKQRSNLFSN